MSAHTLTSTDRTERRLLFLSGVFLGVYSIALTLSDAVRLRTWQVEYRWTHWLGLVIWVGLVWLAHRQSSRLLPGRDPFLFPLATFLTGWGLLTIWRLSTGLGLRQSLWLLVIGLVFLLTIRYDRASTGKKILDYLRRFKYVWLTAGLLLTAITLILGSNPMGVGPRLWLGCCGIYFQPSEPLKLLLIVYLAAYLADREINLSQPRRLLPMLTPTLIMTGLAMLLLIFQRDLGTAAIFLMLYAVIVYTGTGDRRVFWLSLLVLFLAAVIGYIFFDVVNQRVEAWINPWLDPSGRSYQIVQSLLAVANGGLIGRGPGMGNPSLVPIAQSDFIFAAIAEENGLWGTLGILALMGLLVNRGMRLSIRSMDPFQRLLAIGLTVHLVGQSILIIGGNLRLLPLTGVTLPFVSYGGSSLLVSFIELLCLLLISAGQEPGLVAQEASIKTHTRISLFLSFCLTLGLAGTALAAGWWGLIRGPDLLTRTDNPRRSITDRYVKRGSILDRSEHPLAESTGVAGDYTRQYPYPALGPLVGYTDPVYGQAGLEASLDRYLRGLQGYPGLTLWWEHLLYGQPPPGLDVRLSLDLNLQAKADELLAGETGALVMLNASSGEVLAMASSPNFDANQLSENWQKLINDPASPLFNRSAMGLYPTGNSLGAFLLAANQQLITSSIAGVSFTECSLTPAGTGWGPLITSGCAEPTRQLLNSIDNQQLVSLLDQLGLYTAPIFPVETLASPRPQAISDAWAYVMGDNALQTESVLKVSPLQMALASAALSNSGVRPALRLVVAVDTPQSGWVMLPVAGVSQLVFQPQAAAGVINLLADRELPVWQVIASGTKGEGNSKDPTGYAWYLGGTLPQWNGVPFAIAVLLEDELPLRVQEIGRSILLDAIRH